MTFNLIEEGLAMQEASLGKGKFAEKKPDTQPLDYARLVTDYSEPIANVCTVCGRKHWGRFQLCLSCSQME